MGLWIALVLGVVQGVFMFVPVSSTSHLVLVQTWLRDRGSDLPAPDASELVLFDLVVHVGTLVSVVVVMRHGLGELIVGVRRELRNSARQTLHRAVRPGAGPTGEVVWVRFVWLLMVSTAVTGLAGLTLQHAFNRVFGTPSLIAAALVLTGAMLWWTDAMQPERDRGRLRFGWRDEAQLNLGVAVGIGAAQALALAPGLSRSGTTIFAALLLGLHRPLAARYSFTLAIPTILAATMVQLIAVLRGAGFGVVGPAALMVGFVSAAAVGTVALMVVLRLLEQARFRVFSGYVWLLAVVIVVSGVGVSAGH